MFRALLDTCVLFKPLAHRLSSLHSAANEPVFDKVIVITDRSVLDDQLQETIYQFEYRAGVVRKISEKSEGSKSEQVSEALAGRRRKSSSSRCKPSRTCWTR